VPTSLGPAEILVILVVALIVLGPKRLPEAGRQIGKALAEVRRWSSDIQSEIRDVIDTDASTSATSSGATSTTGAPPPTAGADTTAASQPGRPVTGEPRPPDTAGDGSPGGSTTS
jgi:Tat protein translocase TatB subunit